MRRRLGKIWSIVLSLVLLLSSWSAVPWEASAEGDMTAFDIVGSMGLGWNIGNSLDSTGTSPSHERSWGNPTVTQELIDAVKAKGFNTIRIPTTWYTEVTTTTDENGGTVYTINEDWLARVKEIVDYAYSSGMFVILNLHHESWINRADFATAYDAMSEQLTQMWTQIATYFKDYDQHLIFEGMNEPRETGTSLEWTGYDACYEVVNQLNADFVRTVRSVESPYQNTRLLMVPAYAASSSASVYSALEVPQDDYVAVSIHAYSPYNFAMGDGDHTTFSTSYQGELDSIFSDIRYHFTDRDIPVVLGEFSASNYDNTEARCAWATYYLTWTKQLGIPCVLWDNNAYTGNGSESHGYLNRSNLTWYENSEPVVDAMLAVLNDDSVVWGSSRHLPTYQHSDINGSDAIVIYENESGFALDADDANGGNCVPGQNLTTEQLNENREIAIRYDGSVAPVLALTDADWGNWTEFSAYDIDEENGIAYYSYEDITKTWEDVSTAAHLFARAGSDMTVYKIVSIPAAELVTDPDENPDNEETAVLGDVNEDGEKNVADLVLLQRYLTKEETLSQQGFQNGDLNGDGALNGLDLTVLRTQLLAGAA